MKALTQLNAAVTDGDFSNPRGVVSSFHLADPNCPGWFLEVALAPSGLRMKGRVNGQCAMIPLSALLELFRTHAPEVFADEKTIRDYQTKVAAASEARSPRAPVAEAPPEAIKPPE